MSGPAKHGKTPTGDALVAKHKAANALAAGMPFNPNKAAEHGRASANPPRGASVAAEDARATGSTLTENTASAKLGAGKPRLGENPGNLPLDRARTDASERALTTNQGVPIADNQNSLKAGLRGRP